MQTIFARSFSKCSCQTITLKKWMLLTILFSSISYGHGLKQVQSLSLPGPIGKDFEAVKVDYKNHSVYIAHFGANQIYVIDSNTGKYIRTIKGTPGVDGLEYVNSVRKLYIANSKDNSVGVLDLETMKIIKKISIENTPHGMTYASHFKKMYIADELAHTIIVVDVESDKKLTKIHFSGPIGTMLYDAGKKKVYVTLPEQNFFAVIDPDKDAVVAEFSIENCKGNKGMAIDSELHLAFLGCQINHVLAVFDVVQHKTIAEIPLPPGVGDIVYDPGLKRVYVACDSGVISIIQVDDSTHIQKLEDFKVVEKIHSLAVNVENHKVFLPESEDTGTPVTTLIVFDAVVEKRKKDPMEESF